MKRSAHYRSFARRPVSLSGSLAREDDEWEVEVNVVDFGLGGARLVLRRTVAPTTPARLQVVAPNLWDPLVVHGTIVWSSALDRRGTAQLGFAFHHASGTTLRRLVDLIASTAYE